MLLTTSALSVMLTPNIFFREPTMNCNAIAFPENLSPIIFEIGPLKPHWYGLGYVVGILFAWWYSHFLLQKNKLWANNTPPMAPAKIGDFVIYAVLGVILGGRLGEVLLYAPHYLTYPAQIIAIWDGGMSFHGGLIGVTLAMLWFARKNHIPYLGMFDTIAAGVPVGLGVVRVCNFINQELWGRPTDAAWAVCFPRDPLYLPRHPSQLYEAALEGLVLFIILAILIFVFKALKRPGIICGTFVAGYGIARIIVEFYRVPTYGYIYPQAWGEWLTQGMLYSIPMVIVGIICIIYGLRSKPHLKS